MTSEEHKRRAREILTGMFAGNLAVIDAGFAPDFVLHNPSYPEEVRGPAGMRRLVTAFRAGFPDLAYTIDDQIAEGEKVVTRWTARGTHRGELLGVPATGRAVTITGIDIQRFRDGQVIEAWSELDALGMLRQVGAIGG